MSNEKDNQYLLRNRPPSEKLVDVGFKNLAVILASMVAVVLFLILIVVFQGSLESMGRYGWQFLITSDWNFLIQTNAKTLLRSLSPIPTNTFCREKHG